MRAKKTTIIHCSCPGLQKKKLLTGPPRTNCQDISDLVLAREGWRTLHFLVKAKGIQGGSRIRKVYRIDILGVWMLPLS